jgi:hypothetical protein
MRQALRIVPAAVLLVIVVMLSTGCPADRYSVNAEAARIQHLTDFCLGYGALRDAATNFIKVDTQRNTPVLTADMVTSYASARAFIKPFCSPTFDPENTPFDLNNLNDQLLAIRLILLAKENEG